MFCAIYGELEHTNTFIKEFDLKDKESMHQLIVSCYFALTTLSTVGYGDYYPISNQERFVTLIIQLGGVAFFSYIMGNFIEIVANMEANVGPPDKSGDLNNWLILLTRYTRNNIALSKAMTDDIEDHFSYFWTHDRLASLNQGTYIEDLPRRLKIQVITGYLFADIY